MVIEVFCPEFNFQAALGFATTMWLLSQTRVYSNEAKDYRIIPSIPRYSKCSWNLQADQSPYRQSFTITMTTKYNETFFSKSDTTFEPSSLYRVLWNYTSVAKFSTDPDTHVQLLPSKGDPFFVRNVKDTVFLLLHDNFTTDETYVYVIGLHDNTDINIHSGKVPNDSLSFNSGLLDTMQVNSFEHILLNSSYIQDGVLVNSSQPIGLLVTSSAINACDQTDTTWEMVPSTTQMGNSFNIYVPQNQVFLCNFLSSSEGHMTIHYQANSTNISLDQRLPKTLNLTDASSAYITSSVPIQTLCTTWVRADDNKEYKNQFFLLPMEQYSNCSFMVLENCNSSVRPCAIVVGLMSENLQISSLADTTFLSAQKFQNGNITFSIWEIYNLTDGLYSLKTEDGNSFIVYRYDISNGRFFPLEPFTESQCINMSLSNTINDTSPSITDSASSGQTDPVTSVINTMDATTVSVNENSSTEQTTAKTDIDSNNVNVTNSNSQNDTDQNVTSTQKSVGNIVASNIAFPYEELPEDDRMLNEYMIAVIVSLCTAIFAVIALISTFLLLEVLARRKQLRNSKIRPMMS